MKGEMIIVFSQDMFIPENYKDYNDEFLEIKLIPSNENSQAFISLWNITEYEHKSMKIRMTFKNQDIISKSQEKD
jgi:hypothetical protein